MPVGTVRRANAYGHQIEENRCFATLSVNEEEFSHRGAEAQRWTENQIGTIIVDCAAHKKQLLTYLKLTGLSYLLNLGEALMKDGITRIINGHL